MSNEHTPGPWEVAHTTVYALHGEPPRNRFSAVLQSGRRDDAQGLELMANARLMASAPELLEAAQLASRILFLLMPEVERLGLRAENVPAKLRAAIAKATGEPQ